MLRRVTAKPRRFSGLWGNDEFYLSKPYVDKNRKAEYNPNKTYRRNRN